MCRSYGPLRGRIRGRSWAGPLGSASRCLPMTAVIDATSNGFARPIVHFGVGERWNSVDFSRSIVVQRCSIPGDRCLALSAPGYRCLAPAIVGVFQELMAVATKKFAIAFSGTRPGGLQQSVLGGLRARRPVGLAGKPVWRTCRQITRTPLPARYSWPTRGVTLSDGNARGIAPPVNWQAGLAGQPTWPICWQSSRALLLANRAGWVGSRAPGASTRQTARSGQRAINARSTIDQRSGASDCIKLETWTKELAPSVERS